MLLLKVKTMDLFENYEKQPKELQAITSKMKEGMNYFELEKVLKECEAIGYTFEYDLSATPYNLKNMK
tara:strand:- start:2151 stop:2354 length:204 start_codon:yes stop_codon:yes gene_type:complete